MTDRPAVSILMPTLGRWDLVERAVASVLAQTVTDWELLIVNDGGPSLRRHLTRLGERRIRLRQLRRRGGGAAARNVALGMAQGEAVAFLDDDDTWYPWHLAAVASAAARWGALVHGDAELVRLEVRRGRWQAVGARLYTLTADAASLRHHNTLIPSSVVYPRRFHRVLGAFDPTMGHYWDWDWFLRVAARFSVRRAGRLTVRYGLTGLNQSGQPAAMRPDLAVLVARHGLGDLESANFAQLPALPELAALRRPTALPGHWRSPA